MFVGYAVFYFVRKNLSAAQPAMIADLGYSKTQIGVLWSSLYLAYGLSKFVMGVAGDRANARYFMALGLLLSAICNIAFGMSSSLLMLGFFWTLNGWVQGMGWPPCARLLTQWYSTEERGTKWAIWNASHQVGGGIIFILAGWLAQTYGWRSALIIPAVISIATAVFLVERLRDTPESLGLPPIEEHRGVAAAAVDREPPMTLSEQLRKHVFGNKAIWLLSIANFFVYLVRYGAMDWAPTYLVEVKHSTIAGAALKTAGFEFLGIAGAMLAGWASDKLFPGRRSVISLMYMVALAVAVAAFWYIPAGQPMWDAAALSAVGFLVYGPQMLVGVCAADVGGKNAVATVTGFTGFIGYLGSIVSGVGMGFVVDKSGWNGGFILWIASAVIGALCFALASTAAKPTAKAKTA